MIEIAKSDKTHREPGSIHLKTRAREIARASIKRTGGVIRIFDEKQLIGIIYRSMQEALRMQREQRKLASNSETELDTNDSI